MSAVKHPTLFDPVTMKTVRTVFHEVWNIIQQQDALRLSDDDDGLKAAIIRKLLTLVSDGTTDPETMRNEVLKTWPVEDAADPQINALDVQVEGNRLVVTLPGSLFRTTYFKTADGTAIVQAGGMSIDGSTNLSNRKFEALAWMAATSKARELGWM